MGVLGQGQEYGRPVSLFGVLEYLQFPHDAEYLPLRGIRGLFA